MYTWVLFKNKIIMYIGINYFIKYNNTIFLNKYNLTAQNVTNN